MNAVRLSDSGFLAAARSAQDLAAAHVRSGRKRPFTEDRLITALGLRRVAPPYARQLRRIYGAAFAALWYNQP